MKIVYTGPYSSVAVEGVSFSRGEATEAPDELGARILAAEKGIVKPAFIAAELPAQQPRQAGPAR